MVSPILATKLYIPPPPPKVVARPRLIERLNEGVHRKLTVISAPAGFGKTTLVCEWVASLSAEYPVPGAELSRTHQTRYFKVAWLSLDEGDSDPARFLTYLIAALQTVAPNIAEGVLGALQSSQPPPTELVLTALLNEIAGMPDNFLLILDDYQVIDGGAMVPGVGQGVDYAITFLVEHLPPQMHLAITTREDPQLPLSRLRARDQLTELRGSDLRFTPSEAAAFLDQRMGLDLSPEDVATLESRTEGWIAGLQLAALSMQGHDDIPAFIQAFAGDHRYILDYLAGEVLQRQPERVRNFLLQTSILDRLTGSLCDAVTGQQGGNARLEALERGNFFVVRLDDKRHWYRYHHLFAEVLRAHLMVDTAERPDQLFALHRRASEWYEHNGSMPDAIRHALAAEDFERVADLIELHLPAMRRSRQEATLLGWLKALPDELFHRRPVLSAQYGGALLAIGDLEAVEARLRGAERWLEPEPEPEQQADLSARPDAPAADGNEMVVVDEEAFRLLPGSIALWRAALALLTGDLDGTTKYVRQVLDLVPEDDHLERGGAVALMGLAAWASGDLETAHRTYADGMAYVLRAGFIADSINGAIARADIRIAQGRLHEAMRIYEQALQLATQSATEQGVPALRGTADLYVGMSEIRLERNELDAAMQHLLRSKELGEHTGFPQHPYRRRVSMARILAAQGGLDSALDLLGEAEPLYVSDFFPDVRPAAALKARVWVAQGRLGQALDWARERGLSAEDELSYLREFEHITLARVMLAQYKRDGADRFLREATGLLERLLKAAEEGERTGSVIEILVLQAHAYQAQGDTPAALAPLERALRLAEPEGYVRMFVDEGMPMALLLEEAAKHGVAPDYAGRLLAAFGKAQDQDRSQDEEHDGRPGKQVLPEPLSERELEVLRLLGSDLSGPEIAGALMVSLNTMHTHTKNIYTKLGVNNRRAAIRRAEELHLL